MSDQPRKFRQLKAETIREIVAQHQAAIPNSAIARNINVDVSTVRYHIERYENTYGDADVYAVIRIAPKPICQHPSMKCLVCGTAQDAIRRREREEIAHLKAQLAHAHGLLARNNILLE